MAIGPREQMLREMREANPRKQAGLTRPLLPEVYSCQECGQPLIATEKPATKKPATDIPDAVATKKRGRPATGKAMSSTERSRALRARRQEAGDA